MVTYEAMTSQCGRSVVHFLVVRVDIGVVIYEALTEKILYICSCINDAYYVSDGVHLTFKGTNKLART